MADITLTEAVEAFNSCNVGTGENNARAEMAQTFINHGADTGTVAQHSHITPADAECVVNTLNGEQDGQSFIAGVKNSLIGIYNDTTNAISNIVNDPSPTATLGNVIQSATNDVTSGGVENAQRATTSSGMPLRNPTLGSPKR
ncbi:MAG: hypothetical protein KDJ50_04395 [Alphaproteobacteria bacterium]|nr:hypothetical protein [Alphaproteobacteria bacterium]